MNIYVRDANVFDSEDQITVQVRNDHPDEKYYELISCNHAQAEEQFVYNNYEDDQGNLHEWTSKPLICNKCEAFKYKEDSDWNTDYVETVIEYDQKPKEGKLIVDVKA
jgi:hypothetical protein